MNSFTALRNLLITPLSLGRYRQLDINIFNIYIFDIFNIIINIKLGIKQIIVFNSILVCIQHLVIIKCLILIIIGISIFYLWTCWFGIIVRNFLLFVSHNSIRIFFIVEINGIVANYFCIVNIDRLLYKTMFIFILDFVFFTRLLW